MKHNEQLGSYAKRGALLASAVLLATGCANTHEDDPRPIPTISSPEKPQANVVVYEDAEFTKPLGKVAFFDIICADYKDPTIPSLQPAHVISYKVEEAAPTLHTPGLEGYVEPTPRLMVSGVAPAC